MFPSWLLRNKYQQYVLIDKSQWVFYKFEHVGDYLNRTFTWYLPRTYYINLLPVLTDV